MHQTATLADGSSHVKDSAVGTRDVASNVSVSGCKTFVKIESVRPCNFSKEIHENVTPSAVASLRCQHLVRIHADHQVADGSIDGAKPVTHARGNHYYVAWPYAVAFTILKGSAVDAGAVQADGRMVRS